VVRNSLAVRFTGLIAVAALVGACATTPVPLAGGAAGPGMMGGVGATGVAPGSPGFVAGTPSAPRLVRIVAGPGYWFYPSSVTVAAGETVTFAVTAMGPLAHEFKVGPLDVVQADGDAPEIADIGMMKTKTLTYTFAGSMPFGYACHEAGHYEAGMSGTIVVV
jgi:uncharacterized cupredoxin-like copper-binding protein